MYQSSYLDLHYFWKSHGIWDYKIRVRVSNDIGNPRPKLQDSFSLDFNSKYRGLNHKIENLNYTIWSLQSSQKKILIWNTLISNMMIVWKSNSTFIFFIFKNNYRFFTYYRVWISDDASWSILPRGKVSNTKSTLPGVAPDGTRRQRHTQQNYPWFAKFLCSETNISTILAMTFVSDASPWYDLLKTGHNDWRWDKSSLEIRTFDVSTEWQESEPFF